MADTLDSESSSFNGEYRFKSDFRYNTNKGYHMNNRTGEFENGMSAGLSGSALVCLVLGYSIPKANDAYILLMAIGFALGVFALVMKLHAFRIKRELFAQEKTNEKVTTAPN